MSHIELIDIEKHFGSFQAVVDFNLSVEKGEMIALLGPSGCGKTTTLRMIAGFVLANAGTVRLESRDITFEPPYRRNIGMVFQGYALFPHMNVAGNVAFGLQMRALPKHEIDKRVAVALERVRLEKFADRMPRQLSGGQQQRVALARAMAINPDVLLLDEPLSALDARLRQDVRDEIRELQRSLRLTTLIVTHDQDEALSMADRVVVMNRGAIEQVGTPATIYERPANRFVAEFLGKSNFLEGRVEGPGLFRTHSGHALRYLPGGEPDAASFLSFRPEKAALVISEAGPVATPVGDYNSLSGRLALATYLGPVVEYKVTTASGESLVVLQTATDSRAPEPGAEVAVRWSARDSRLLS